MPSNNLRMPKSNVRCGGNARTAVISSGSPALSRRKQPTTAQNAKGVFLKLLRKQNRSQRNTRSVRANTRACAIVQNQFVTLKSNPHEEIGGTAGHICPLTKGAHKQIAEDENTRGKTCPIQSRILNSNFKTGAINRSATPPT
jgi:hypothetical protein